MYSKMKLDYVLIIVWLILTENENKTKNHILLKQSYVEYISTSLMLILHEEEYPVLLCWLMSVSGQQDARRKRDFPFESFSELCSQHFLSRDLYGRRFINKTPKLFHSKTRITKNINVINYSIKQICKFISMKYYHTEYRWIL